jgi:geranyl diphosphate synthase
MPQTSDKQTALLGAGEGAASDTKRFTHSSLKVACAGFPLCFLLLVLYGLRGAQPQEEQAVELNAVSVPKVRSPMRQLGNMHFALGNRVPQPSNMRFDLGNRLPGFLARNTLSAAQPPNPSTIFEPADLTPAVDKYARLPAVSDRLDMAPDPFKESPEPEGPDPFKSVEKELQPLSQYVGDMVQSENPVLTMAAGHFFNQKQGKRFRPTIIVLMGRALRPEGQAEDITQRQRSLAQITEMIHAASLIHDDVLDDAETRRGGKAVHALYSNKVAVLGGDYLLARASVLLARLQHLQVVEVMASALDSLVQGEIMQANPKKDQLLDMEYYLRKSYFKTASLISNACKSTALLSGYAEQSDETIAAEKFGYHLGMAYQIVDDILDFTGASADLGKPAQADMKLGLATAPILYAAEANADIKPLILRRFKEQGDIQKAVGLAAATDCVAKSYELADFHAQNGIYALLKLPESSTRDAMLRLLHTVLTRKS